MKELLFSDSIISWIWWWFDELWYFRML